VIIQRMLRKAGLTRRAILPLSAGLLANTDRYFESLNTYRAGEIEPLVSTFVDAAFSSLDNASRLARDLSAVRDSWNETVSARADSTVWPLIDSPNWGLFVRTRRRDEPNMACLRGFGLS